MRDLLPKYFFSLLCWVEAFAGGSVHNGKKRVDPTICSNNLSQEKFCAASRPSARIQMCKHCCALFNWDGDWISHLVVTSS